MAAREQWEACLARLRASSRPDAAAVEEIIRDLVGLPYPLDFCREADVVGNLLCDLCRLARLVRQFGSVLYTCFAGLVRSLTHTFFGCGRTRACPSWG